MFTLTPQLNIYRSRPSGNGAYRYLNTKTYGYRHGLGFGGSLEQSRLFIPESLEGCTARDECLTYETGSIIEDTYDGRFKFEIDIMEIWGCGGDEIVSKALNAQKEARALNDTLLQNARKCDKAAFFNTSVNNEFLLANTLQHRQQTDDRAI